MCMTSGEERAMAAGRPCGGGGGGVLHDRLTTKAERRSMTKEGDVEVRKGDMSLVEDSEPSLLMRRDMQIAR